MVRAANGKHVIHTDEAAAVKIRGLGVRFLLNAEHVSIVEHPLAARCLGSPVHTHANEDEYSYVLEGEFGIELGDETFTAAPGTLVVKPKGIPHAFWNAGDTPARLLEIISPVGFEHYFEEMAKVFPVGRPPSEQEMTQLADIRERYGLSMDMASVARLMEQHGLTS